MESKGEMEPEFPAFPYEPYSIQVDFMKSLYHALNKGGVSMLESPTGTGKTLSIICSALQWVVDQRQKQKNKTEVESDQNQRNEGEFGTDDEPDWMRNFVSNKDNQVEELKIMRNKKFAGGSGKPDKRRNRETGRNLFSRDVEEEEHHLEKEHKTSCKGDVAEEIRDEEFLLEEYISSDEGADGAEKSKRKVDGALLSSSSDEDKEDDESEEDREKLKVYFCSRTHSQLSQFVKELRKTVFASEMKVVCLGSRKNFCINEDVQKLGNPTRINERCLELQRNKNNETSKIRNIGAGQKLRRTKASCGCPMLRKQKLQKQFRSEISQEGALDIEDLVHLGRSMGTCPYYGSRSMIREADLVVLPYQSLLSKSSRESLGIDLKRSIIIIDEAHNLADSLISMYDSKITFSQLENMHYHLERYFERFRNLLGPGNRRYIQTLMVLTRAFLKTFLGEDTCCLYPCKDPEKASGTDAISDFSMAINDFLFSLNIDNINLVKLLQYIKESNIIHKVSGYGDKITSMQNGSEPNYFVEFGEEESTISSFRALVDMLLSLTNIDGDGRIIISRNRPLCSRQQGGYIKYVMLTGEKIFSEIVNNAHAVLLAGGTLQPIEDTRERLFPWLPLSQLHFFSCSHIVPPESVLAVAVSRGPTGQSFDFSYSSRSSSAMIQEMGLLLCNLVIVVPEGVVVFFSSFDYEAQVYDAWKASGILERIMKKKHIFREPRKNADVDSVLQKYKEMIDALSKRDSNESKASQTGAILFAIVGGKISEGINLSDGMGRCIVMIGLPYPSPSDIELIERVKHIEGLGDSNSIKSSKICKEFSNGDVQAGFEILRSCRRGKEYYENLCMKAVNQSIGRAIRHVKDYAAILLVDSRYASSSTKRSFSHPANKLPQWIKDRVVSSTGNYGDVHRKLHQFFKFNNKKGYE